jgi:ribonuclease D
LIPVYEALEKQLKENGRHGWLDEEMAVLTSPETYRAEPEHAWRRLAGRMRKPREIAVLMEVAAWREREAQSRDVPRGRVLKDEAAIDLAVSAPRSVEALGRLRSIPTGFERSRQAQDILAAVERGLARDPKTVPVPERPARRQSTGAIVELLKVLLKAIAEQEGVATKIIATVDDLEAIAESDAAEVPPLHGWRRQLFGEKALALKHGELGLSVNKGRVVVTPTQVAEAATSPQGRGRLAPEARTG